MAELDRRIEAYQRDPSQSPHERPFSSTPWAGVSAA
jgi:hypothetical protein